MVLFIQKLGKEFKTNLHEPTKRNQNDFLRALIKRFLMQRTLSNDINGLRCKLIMHPLKHLLFKSLINKVELIKLKLYSSLILGLFFADTSLQKIMKVYFVFERRKIMRLHILCRSE